MFYSVDLFVISRKLMTVKCEAKVIWNDFDHKLILSMRNVLIPNGNIKIIESYNNIATAKWIVELSQCQNSSHFDSSTFSAHKVFSYKIVYNFAGDQSQLQLFWEEQSKYFIRWTIIIISFYCFQLLKPSHRENNIQVNTTCNNKSKLLNSTLVCFSFVCSFDLIEIIIQYDAKK